MGKKAREPRKTKRIRIQLDFVLEAEEPMDNLPLKMDMIANGFIHVPSKPVIKELEKLKMTTILGGALMTVGLDYRKRED